jgi:mannosyltransferase OCH1-like enzyme
LKKLIYVKGGKYFIIFVLLFLFLLYIMNKIPKIIHQIWLQGEENVSPTVANNIKKIKEINNDFKYYLWDEIKILELVKKDDSLLKKYYGFIYLHQKVDFAKIVILKYYGGIYIDIDCDVVKNLNDIFIKYNKYDLIVSKLNDKIDLVSSLLTCHKKSNCYNNGVIIGKPNTPVLNYLIENFKSQCSFYENKLLCIQNTTGPPIFNTLIDKYIENYDLNKTKILILPFYYFEPCIGENCEITDETLIIHKHELSWLSEDQKKLFKYLSQINLLQLVLLIISIVGIYLFIKLDSKFINNIYPNIRKYSNYFGK